VGDLQYRNVTASHSVFFRVQTQGSMPLQWFYSPFLISPVDMRLSPRFRIRPLLREVILWTLIGVACVAVVVAIILTLRQMLIAIS
jgi:hypothetical protein